MDSVDNSGLSHHLVTNGWNQSGNFSAGLGSGDLALLPDDNLPQEMGFHELEPSNPGAGTLGQNSYAPGANQQGYGGLPALPRGHPTQHHHHQDNNSTAGLAHAPNISTGFAGSQLLYHGESPRAYPERAAQAHPAGRRPYPQQGVYPQHGLMPEATMLSPATAYVGQGQVRMQAGYGQDFPAQPFANAHTPARAVRTVQMAAEDLRMDAPDSYQSPTGGQVFLQSKVLDVPPTSHRQDQVPQSPSDRTMYSPRGYPSDSGRHIHSLHLSQGLRDEVGLGANKRGREQPPPRQARTRAAAAAQAAGSSDEEGRGAKKRPSRSSMYRGVTKHRRSGRWEAHVWVKELGRQVYLGGYEQEAHAAEAYDVAALKCKGANVKINFGMERYKDLMDLVHSISLEELVMAVRRQSQGFSRGSSSFRGVTYHPTGRWEARIGIPGSRHIYLGLFNQEQMAARNYDRSLVRLRGPGAATNFGLADYRTDLADYHKMQQMVLRADKDWAKKMVGSSEFEEWIKSGEGLASMDPTQPTTPSHVHSKDPVSASLPSPVDPIMQPNVSQLLQSTPEAAPSKAGAQPTETLQGPVAKLTSQALSSPRSTSAQESPRAKSSPGSDIVNPEEGANSREGRISHKSAAAEEAASGQENTNGEGQTAAMDDRDVSEVEAAAGKTSPAPDMGSVPASTH